MPQNQQISYGGVTHEFPPSFSQADIATALKSWDARNSSAPSSAGSLTTQQFAGKIRAKFPGSYDDLSDADLSNKVLAKYPQYQSQVAITPAPSHTPTAISQDPPPITANGTDIATRFGKGLAANTVNAWTGAPLGVGGDQQPQPTFTQDQVDANTKNAQDNPWTSMFSNVANAPPPQAGDRQQFLKSQVQPIANAFGAQEYSQGDIAGGVGHTLGGLMMLRAGNEAPDVPAAAPTPTTPASGAPNMLQRHPVAVERAAAGLGAGAGGALGHMTGIPGAGEAGAVGGAYLGRKIAGKFTTAAPDMKPPTLDIGTADSQPAPAGEYFAARKQGMDDAGARATADYSPDAGVDARRASARAAYQPPAQGTANPYQAEIAAVAETPKPSASTSMFSPADDVDPLAPIASTGNAETQARAFASRIEPSTTGSFKPIEFKQFGSQTAKRPSLFSDVMDDNILKDEMESMYGTDLAPRNPPINYANTFGSQLTAANEQMVPASRQGRAAWAQAIRDENPTAYATETKGSLEDKFNSQTQPQSPALSSKIMPKGKPSVTGQLKASLAATPKPKPRPSR